MNEDDERKPYQKLFNLIVLWGLWVLREKFNPGKKEFGQVSVCYRIKTCPMPTVTFFVFKSKKYTKEEEIEKKERKLIDNDNFCTEIKCYFCSFSFSFLTI
ncbi:hypothetical protein AAHE18_11G063400 [Arachis hypogaea]